MDESKRKFRWCEKLFEQIPIRITLPASLLCKSCIINSILNSNSGASASISQMSVKQLDLNPGFGTKGLFHINLPNWIPPVVLNFGYIQMDIWGGGASLITGRFPQGFLFDTRNPEAAFMLEMILKADIAAQVQAMIDYLFLLEHSSLPLSVGASGLFIGKDAAHQIITFSKIFVDMKLEDLRPHIVDISNTLIRSYSRPGIVKLQGLDLDVKSSTSILAGFQSNIFNPTSITLDIGSISIGVASDGESLARIQLPQMSVIPGLQAFNLSMDAQIASGDSPFNAVGAIIEDITHQAQNHGTFSGFELSGLIFYPRNHPNGPGKIDMLSQIVIKIPSSLIHSLVESILSDTAAGDSVIDMSAFIPSEKQLVEMRPVLRAVEFRALPGSTLKAGFSAEYTNPLPISIIMPYAEATLTLGDFNHEMMTVGLSGLRLNRGRGLINLNAYMEFNRVDPELPSNFGLLVSNFISGQIYPSLGIKNITFGLNSNDKNRILQDISLDLQFITNHLGWIGPRLSEYLEHFLMEYLDANAINIHGSLQKRGLYIGLGDSLSVSVQDIDVGFLPSKEIMIQILGNYVIPFDVDVSLPYFGAFISLDDLPFVGAEIEGIVINGRSDDRLSFKMILKAYDDDALADQLGLLSDSIRKNEPISNSLQFSKVVFGESREDITSVFSEIKLPLPLSSVWKLSSRVIEQFTRTVSIDDLIESLGVQIHSINAVTLPKQTIRCGADVAFNVINMSVSGLGYIFSDIGLTQTPLLSVISPGISFNPGLNVMNVSTDIQFPSSLEIQDKVALLVSDVVSGKLQIVNESKFDISGVVFGVSESESIRFLRKVQLDIPASLLLNPTILNFVLSTVKKVLNTDFPHLVENILGRMNVYSVSLDASESSHMSLDGIIGIKGIPLKLNLEVGHFDGLATLNEER